MATLENIPADLYIYFDFYTHLCLSRTSKLLNNNCQPILAKTKSFKRELDVSNFDLVSLFHRYNNSKHIGQYILTMYQGNCFPLVKDYFNKLRDREKIIHNYGFSKDFTVWRFLEKAEIQKYHNTHGYFFWAVETINFDILKKNAPIELYLSHLSSYVLDWKKSPYDGYDDYDKVVSQSKVENVLNEVVNRMIELYQNNDGMRKQIDKCMSSAVMRYNFESQYHRLNDWYHKVGKKKPFCKTLWCILKSDEREKYESDYFSNDIQYKIAPQEEVKCSNFPVHITNLTRDQGLKATLNAVPLQYTVCFDDAMPSIFVPYVWMYLSPKERRRYENHLNYKYKIMLISRIEKARKSKEKEIVLHTLARMKICYNILGDKLMYLPTSNEFSPDDYFEFWFNHCSRDFPPIK